jgi:hypothetical protein
MNYQMHSDGEAEYALAPELPPAPRLAGRCRSR